VNAPNPTVSGAPSPDPAELLRSRAYVVMLAVGALIGAPVAAVAYFFLKVVSYTSTWVFTTLPGDLGFSSEPLLWPLLPLTVSGLLVGLTLRHLRGTGGHKPAEGFKAGGATVPIELPGIILASFFTLSLGVVLGPEAPLIAIGSGLGVLALQFLKKDAPDTAFLVIGAAGSFAAISSLLGSPLVGAFLLMEAAGIGGPLMAVVLIPGLLAAGIGTLIFIGLDSWTGYGTQSLAIPDIPPFTTPTVAEFLWAIGIGLAAAVLGAVIRRGALWLQPIIERRMVLLTPIVGFGIGACAVVFAQFTDHESADVLFSGQDALPGLIEGAAGWTVGALILVVICKGIAYALALSSFRGGPTFPGMFIGAAGGIALAHLPGLPMIAGAAMGIGAMCVAMLGLPMTSVLLAVLFLSADGLALTPLVIVSVIVSYVASAHLVPPAHAAPGPETRSSAEPQH
jgi:H+/Cl- antiporter ClcA